MTSDAGNNTSTSSFHHNPGASLESVLRTEELRLRPSRPPDYRKENRALVALAEALSNSPETVLQVLANTILNVCQAGSAGISLLTTEDDGKRFYWPAIAGEWKAHIGGGTPRDFGPCGDVLDFNRPLLFGRLERRYTYFEPVKPSAEEALLVPFYVGNKAVGTIWAVAHDSHKFDAEDERLLSSLGKFASSAYQVVTSLNALRHQVAEREKADTTLRDFIETSTIPMHWVGPNGIIQWANHAELQLLGYKNEEYIGRHIFEFHVDREVISDILARLTWGEKLQNREAQLRCKDGSIRSVVIDSSALFEDGKFVHTRCFTRDITDQKNAERAMGLLAAIVDSSDDAIVSKNLDGIITSWNVGAMRLFGYKAEEAIGQSITLIVPSDRLEEEKMILNCLKRGERVDHFETVRLRRDGTEMDVSLTISPVKDKANRVVGASKVARDISERKQIERILRENEDRLTALARNLERQVNVRTSELEHRNSEILQQSEQLRGLSGRLRQSQDDERRRIARELHDSAGQIVTALSMNLARIARHPGNVDVAKTVQESGELVDQLSKEIRTLSYLLHPPLLDETGLHEAIRWYAEGLTKRSGLDVTLEVSDNFGRLPQEIELAVFRIVQECLTNIHRHSGSKTATIRLLLSDGIVSLEIQDAGRGMPVAGPSGTHGHHSGVGITGIRERVRHLAGTMAIESNGNGTKISITLPAKSSESFDSNLQDPLSN